MASSPGQLPVTVDNIQEAIRLMYGQTNPDPAATQAASRWLSAAKTSPEAWDFLWMLLMPDKVSQQIGQPATMDFKWKHAYEKKQEMA